jgi:nucleoid-associated protein
MPLQDAVLIKLSRRDFAGSVTIYPAKSALPADGPVYSLFEQAKQGLNKSAQKRFGFFDPEAENKQLVGLLHSWQDKGIDFISFANKAGLFLQQMLEQGDTPFEYAVMVAHETVLEQNYLYAMALPMKEMMQLNGELEPVYTEVIDSARLSFALRLHLEQYADGSPKFLTQLAPKGAKDLNDSFHAFSAFKEGIDIKAQTEEFIHIVDAYTDELDDESQKDMKTQIMSYCVDQDAVGLPVQLNELSEQLDDAAPEKFAEYVATNQQSPSPEVHTDRSALKRYMRYFGRDNSISINFSSERLGSDIFYQPSTGSLRIDNVPKSLKKQLAGFADKLDSTPNTSE